MKRIILSASFILAASICAFAQKTKNVTSPDGKICVAVTVDKDISYDVWQDGTRILSDCKAAMEIAGQKLAPGLRSARVTAGVSSLKPVVAFKYSGIEAPYNDLTLKFNGYALTFRVYNDGFAYHFSTAFKGDIEVLSETFRLGFPQDYTLHVQTAGGFVNSYEELYQHFKASEWPSRFRMATLPLLVDLGDGHRMLVSESALSDYAGCFMQPCNGGVEAVQPKVPSKVHYRHDRTTIIDDEEAYVARTSGTRDFPWRYFVLSRNDGEILENTMTARLARPCKIVDPSWIKPGVTTWEWWNGAVPYGPEVDFVAGCNTETYKYFIDFASKFGVEYILLDEGWANAILTPFEANPNLDLKELISYGRKKNVGVILWLTWLSVEENFDNLFKTYADWGVSGVKIDFMDRTDQWMVNFYERCARSAAENRLFIDFHGSFKPSGLEYEYPNILSYEGVRGMEYNENCRPENTLWEPFLRNAVGPMDFTPGAMLNYQPGTLRANRPNAGCIGTRACQMAMFVLFETGLQMMADNPALYYMNADCARFMAGVPICTDETVALDAKAGEYLVVAKRKGDNWYIGGMTNGTERDLEIPLSFLGDGRNRKMTSYVDGANANRQAMHYNKKVQNVTDKDVISVHMARNGGFAAVIE